MRLMIRSLTPTKFSRPLLLFLILTNSMVFNGWSAEQYLPTSGTTTPREMWEAYLQNREKIEAKLSETPGEQTVHLAVRIATAAILLEVDGYEEHLQRAITLDAEARKQKGRYSSTLFFLIGPLIDTGRIDAAIELAQQSKLKSNFGDPKISESIGIGIGGVIDGKIAEAVGDYAAEEASLIQKMPLLRVGNPDFLYHNVFVSSQFSRLATCQAMQGKHIEAGKSLEQAFALRKKGSNADFLSKLSDDLRQRKIRVFDTARFWEIVRTANACLLVGKDQEAQELISTGLEMRNLEHIEQTQELWKIYVLAGRACFQRGKALDAVDHWKEALTAVRRPHPKSGFTLPEDHTDIISIKQGLAWALLQAGDPAAESQALTIRDAQMKFVDRLFRFASESQRLAFLQTSDPYSLLAETGQIEALAESILRLKGSVLDSVLEDKRMARQTDSPELSGLARDLRVAKRMAFEAAWGNSEDAAKLASEVQNLEAKLGSMTRMSSSARGALSVSTNAIQDALHPGDHLCEFIRYQRISKGGGTIPWYGAMIFSSGKSPVWRALSEAGPIDDAILLLKQGMSQEIQIAEGDLQSLLETLYQSILAPIESLVPEGDRLILSPDGNLSCLSFAVLLDAGNQFAASRWEITYVSTGRDLLEVDVAPDKRMSLAVFADPEFSAETGSGSKLGKQRSVTVPFSLDLPVLPPLPGTRKELIEIENIAREFEWKIESHAGAAANETVIATWKETPDIIHFATHGLFLKRQDSVAAAANISAMQFSPSKRVDNPLMRSLLTLAGAQSTLNQWGKQDQPAPQEDGILTAEEISQMSLEDTWLATLSACDTASGEALEGEGVLGLRRGFFLAGVDHLIMTFWPIADEETVSFISDFYRSLGEIRHPGLALSKTQAKALTTIREESGLSSAVMFAGPFAASISGQLPQQ